MLTSVAVLLPLLAGLAAADDEPRPPPGVRRVIIERQLIMRVPVRPRLAPPSFWKERGGGPRCLATRDLVGAILAGPQAIDFVLRDQGRYRARLDSGCPTLDFYGGFYLQPAGPQVCAQRDSIRSRMGASCRIEQFRRLEPPKASQLP